MIIPVPHYSQFLDVTLEEWKARSCGVACLKMLLDVQSPQTPALDEMILQGEAIGAHGESGWKHDGLIALARQYGEKLSRSEWRQSDTKTSDELNKEGIDFLVKTLDLGTPIIVSAIKKFKEIDKFHTVLLTGYEIENDRITGFYYHDSDVTTRGDGENLFVPINVFEKNWRRMAIYKK